MNGEIIHGDSLQVLSGLADCSIDLVLTDPPYFLDKMDNGWDDKKVDSTKYQHVVKLLPAGMKFDRDQGRKFYEWYYKISQHILRVLKPGGFFFSFSSPRLYHRMVCAIDDAGLLIRDCFIWLYTQNQPKAMSLNHFIDRLNENDHTKINLKNQLTGWKTPQIKSCFEPIVMAQKEPQGTFLENFRKYNVGLLNTNIKIGQDMFPANVISTDTINEVVDKCFLIGKPNKKEKGDFNTHKTVKPLSLCEYIINLTTYSNEAVVLDPFAGSGTTIVAAKKLGRKFIGIDMNSEYIKVSKRRIEDTHENYPIYITNEKSQLKIFDKKSAYNKKRPTIPARISQ